MAAHLFVFWFALLSTITPPVCGTVFIAAGMAGAPWLRVAAHAMLLGVGLYLIPLAMMADLSLIALSDNPVLALAALVRVGLGLYLVSTGLIGRSQGAGVRLAQVCAGVTLLFLPGLIDAWPQASG